MQNLIRNGLGLFCFAAVFCCFPSVLAAQFPIKIPKVPKVSKPSSPSDTGTPGSTSTSTSSTGTPSGSASRGNGNSNSGRRTYENEIMPSVPAAITPMVFIKAVVSKSYWKMPNASNVTSWIPEVQIHLFWDDRSPLQTIAEYYNPDGTLWFTEPLQTAGKMLRSNETWTLINSKSTNATGVYSIKVKNKGTGATIFAGKFKVNKFLASFNTADKNKLGFYVDHDWLVPLGMVSLDSPDLTKGANSFLFSTWLKGGVGYEELEGELLYNGRSIAKRKATSGMSYEERSAENSAAFHKDSIIKRWQFEFENVQLHNGNSYNIEDNREWYNGMHWLDKNPGQYVFKLFRNGAQIREMAFSVGADGRIARPPYSDSFISPNHGVLLPAKVTGTSEKWTPGTWKTDMFYGNPLAGF